MIIITEDISLYQLFSHLIRYHNRRMHILLDEIEIYPGQPPILFALTKKDGQSQNELAEKILIKPSTATIMFKRMEKCGYITRKKDQIDKRIIRVYITDAGKDIHKEIKKRIIQINEECFDTFTKEEKIIFRRLLLQMINNLDIKEC